ncbi:MAG: antibiotic biosynthesis monooxygenase [Gammaproteobacteria bacterium]|nr:antibiotic biosynthesis monooxygenase [Gammaproteobacteria bacterium]
MMTAINIFSGGQSQLREVAAAIESEILPTLRKQHGFRGSRLYRRCDGIELVQCTDWESLADHDASSDSAELAMVGMRLADLLDSGEIEMYVDAYEIAASA